MARFFKMPIEIAQRKDLSGTAKLVYAAIVDRLGSRGVAWPSERKIAEDIGASRNAVRRAIGNLVRGGLIKSHKRERGQSAVYEVVDSGAETIPVERLQNDTTSGLEMEPLEVAPFRNKGGPVSDKVGAETIPLVAPKRDRNQIDPRTRPKNQTNAGAGAREAAAERIRQLYPKKAGKGAALKAIANALKRGKTEAELTEAVTAYAKAVEKWPDSDRQFVPYPSTWFNQERYDDDRATWNRGSDTTRVCAEPGKYDRFD